jgi:hypothetical protein
MLNQQGILNLRDIADLNQQQSDIIGQKPGFLAASRDALRQEEVTKAQTRFQQALAGKQFDLAARTQDAAARNDRGKLRLAKTQQGIDKNQADKNRALEYDKLQQQKDLAQNQMQLDAANKQYDNYTKSINAGETFLNGYLKPAPGETTKRGKGKPDKVAIGPRDPGFVYNKLTGPIGLTREQAINLMSTTNNPDLQNWAFAQIEQAGTDQLLSNPSSAKAYGKGGGGPAPKAKPKQNLGAKGGKGGKGR